MKRRRAARPRRRAAAEPGTGHLAALVSELRAHQETGPRLTGGDLDADWKSAWDAGDEAVGGSTAVPDQDIVDELGDALGIPLDSDAEVRTSGEILAERDRHRWTLEREAAREARAVEDEEREL